MKKLIVAAFAVIGLAFGGATVANATEQETWWLVPAGAQLEVTDHPQGDGHRVGSDGFPQTLINSEADIPCGRFAQVDLYPADVVDGLTADGVLYEGEDYDVISSWRFVYGGDCTPPDCPEGTVPGWLNERGEATSCVDDHATRPLKVGVTELVQPTVPTRVETASN